MYNEARLLKDVVYTFMEDSPGRTFERESMFKGMLKSEKDYWRWKSRILLKNFAPYYRDGVGEIVTFNLIDKNVVLKEWLNNDYEVQASERITVDEFIEEELFFVHIKYPTTRRLMDVLEEFRREQCKDYMVIKTEEEED